jgi:hypothetical protein
MLRTQHPNVVRASFYVVATGARMSIHVCRACAIIFDMWSFLVVTDCAGAAIWRDHH